MRSSDLAAAGRVGVYGFAREGQAVARHLAHAAPGTEVVVLLDDPPDDQTRAALDGADLDVVAGRDAVTDLLRGDAVDVVLRSPGVPVHHGPLADARAARDDLQVTTSNSLWFGDHQPERLVAVTGTKGKSTTVTLLAHLLRSAGHRVALAGNIGRPLIELGAPDDVDVVVVELSSYQLADLDARVPVGVWLNIHREHLPWHGSFDRYVADKGRIVPLSDVLVANAADREVAGAAAGHPDVRWFDAAGDPVRVGDVELDRDELVDVLGASPLVGTHHVANLAAALAAAALVGVTPRRALPAVPGVAPLAHRLQLVHDDGRLWVDDSIATIPEATVAALDAFPDTPVTLVAGGSDRGQDHDPLVAAVAARGDVTVVTLPDTGRRLAAELRAAGIERVHEAADLATAVARARSGTPTGGVVLLSPAAPSFGQFRSFEDRGEQFAALARADG